MAAQERCIYAMRWPLQDIPMCRMLTYPDVAGGHQVVPRGGGHGVDSKLRVGNSAKAQMQAYCQKLHQRDT